MAIDQSEIAIVVPTYKYRDMVIRAVRSALASQAGEIIVTDDRSGDGTIQALEQFSDQRLTVVENERNLGLWENHRHALSMTKRPWIKFVQADDFLLPDGLARYAEAAAPGVTLVSCSPIVLDEISGERSYFHKITRKYRLSTRTLLDGCLQAGWLPGSPSHMLLRAEAIEREPEVWRTSISADLAIGAIAASRGDTVLLPPGAICQGRHPNQDASNQGAARGLTRLVSTLEYLRRRPEQELRRFSNLLHVMSLKRGVRLATRGLLYGEGDRSTFARLAARLVVDPGFGGWLQAAKEWERLGAAHAFRSRHRGSPVNLDELFSDSRTDLNR